VGVRRARAGLVVRVLLSWLACACERPAVETPTYADRADASSAAGGAAQAGAAPRDASARPTSPSDAGGEGGSGIREAAVADAGAAAVDGAASSGDAGQAPPLAAATRGATLPYLEYEAELAETNGVILAPSRSFGQVAAESSGRSAVRLERTGQYIRFTTERSSNAIVVRYVIPDAPTGGGLEATLGVYVNGARKQSLTLTSRYAWLYGGESASDNNVPGAGAHHFYDEVHASIGEVPAGAVVTLQKDAIDQADYYVIDLIDLEQVPPAIEKPADALSITDFGATADDGGDDAAAIQRAIDAAKQQKRSVWIPRGEFSLPGTPLQCAGVTLRGAGMWHTILSGAAAQLKVSGNDNQFYDFALFGAVTARHDNIAENALDGPAGTGSRLENVWIEHYKVGWWVGKGAFPGVPSAPLTDGLVIRGARIRNTFADGINLCNGTSRTIVEQSQFRGTGDDALASWAPAADGPQAEHNTFRFNTVQMPWRANCFAVYGGSDMQIQDNVCADPLLYPGILISTTFTPHPFAGTTTIERNTLIRAGGPMYAQQHGALKIFADTADIANVHVQDLLIESPTFSGIHFQGPKLASGIVLDNVEIRQPGTVGIVVNSNALGGAQASRVIVTGSQGLQNDAPSRFTIEKLAGNGGW
jgi:hypothetical protein